MLRTTKSILGSLKCVQMDGRYWLTGVNLAVKYVDLLRVPCLMS
jgi:hypothetical protein